MKTVSEKYVDVHGEVWDSTDEEGRKYTLSLGNEIIPLSDEESARWRKAVEPVINDYITNTPDGETYVEKIRRIDEKIISNLGLKKFPGLSGRDHRIVMDKRGSFFGQKVLSRPRVLTIPTKY